MYTIKVEINKIISTTENCTKKSSEEWEKKLITMCENKNEYIRANAILSFGILARRFKKLHNLDLILKLLDLALENETNFVKGGADASKDDIDVYIL
jgi:hypothetical protein